MSSEFVKKIKKVDKYAYCVYNMGMKPKQEPFNIRFDPCILAEVKAMSKFERRSINEQVLFMLECYIEKFEIEHPSYDGPTKEDEERTVEKERAAGTNAV